MNRRIALGVGLIFSLLSGNVNGNEQRHIDVTIQKPKPAQDAGPQREDVKMDLSKALVGVWQKSDVLGSGWDDAYQFFEDGRFIFNANQMVASKREISRSGTWKVTNGRLVLAFEEKVIVKGGKLVKDSLSADGKGLEGGAKETVKINPPKIERLALVGLQREKWGEKDWRLTLMFGKDRLWKFRDDPSDYR